MVRCYFIQIWHSVIVNTKELHTEKPTFFHHLNISAVKAEDKQWDAGCSISGKDESSTEAVCGSLPFYRLLRLVMVQCVLPDRW